MRHNRHLMKFLTVCFTQGNVDTTDTAPANGVADAVAYGGNNVTWPQETERLAAHFLYLTCSIRRQVSRDMLDDTPIGINEKNDGVVGAGPNLRLGHLVPG